MLVGAPVGAKDGTKVEVGCESSEQATSVLCLQYIITIDRHDADPGFIQSL